MSPMQVAARRFLRRRGIPETNSNIIDAMVLLAQYERDRREYGWTDDD